MAIANIEDQADEAYVEGYGGAARGVGYWSGIGVALVAASGLAFLLLPWDSRQTPQSAQMVIVPFNGQDEGGQPGIMADQARAVMAKGRVVNGQWTCWSRGILVWPRPQKLLRTSGRRRSTAGP